MRIQRDIRPLVQGKRFLLSCQQECVARVWSIHKKVINLKCEDGLLALAVPQAGGSSRFLTLSRLPELEPGDILLLSSESLDMCGMHLDLTKVPVWCGPLPQHTHAELNEEKSATFYAAMNALAIRPVVNDGVPLEPYTVSRWIGLGPGLTPAGDDVLLGYLAMDNHLGHDTAWSAAMKRAVEVNLERTTLLSRELLRSALDHDYHETIQQVLAIFCGLTSGNLRTALRKLAQVGATSGESMIYGMWLALQRIAHGETTLLSVDRTAFYSEKKCAQHMLNVKEQSERMTALF